MNPASEQHADRPYDYALAFPEGNPPIRERTDSASAMPTKLQDLMDRVMGKAA